MTRSGAMLQPRVGKEMIRRRRLVSRLICVSSHHVHIVVGAGRRMVDRMNVRPMIFGLRLDELEVSAGCRRGACIRLGMGRNVASSMFPVAGLLTDIVLIRATGTGDVSMIVHVTRVRMACVDRGLIGVVPSGKRFGMLAGDRALIPGRYAGSGTRYVIGNSDSLGMIRRLRGLDATIARACLGMYRRLRRCAGGSLIEIEDYRNGYRRHKQHLTYWPDPDSASFRGGGPGEGK